MRVIWALVSCVVMTLPFLTTRWLPVTDLPQHLSQAPLFWDAITNPASAYEVHWATPYSLVYGIVGFAWWVFGPERAGQATMILLGIAWVLAVHAFAARHNRSVASAILASSLFLSQPTYWGFLSFVAGGLAFLVWFSVCEGRERSRGWELVRFFMAGGLLYVSHVLWLAAGVGWLGLRHLAVPERRASLVWRGLGVSPWLVVAAIWYPSLDASGFDSMAVWTVTPFGRLTFTWLTEAMYGGLRGWLEYVMAASLVAWAGIGIWSGRHLQPVHMGMLGAAGLFLTVALVLPSSYQNTIVMAQRWVPTAAVLALLAMPAPLIPGRTQRPLAIALIAVFALATSTAWLNFRSEISGIEESIAALPPGKRVVGLTHVQQSAYVRNLPLLQMYAYAQVDRKAELNFSFAEFAPLPVVFRDLDSQRRPWTKGLEWDPEGLSNRDLDHFDYAIIAANDAVHTGYAKLGRTQPITRSGLYRLYRVFPEDAGE